MFDTFTSRKVTIFGLYCHTLSYNVTLAAARCSLRKLFSLWTLNSFGICWISQDPFTTVCGKLTSLPYGFPRKTTYEIVCASEEDVECWLFSSVHETNISVKYLNHIFMSYHLHVQSIYYRSLNDIMYLQKSSELAVFKAHKIFSFHLAHCKR